MFQLVIQKFRSSDNSCRQNKHYGNRLPGRFNEVKDERRHAIAWRIVTADGQPPDFVLQNDLLNHHMIYFCRRVRTLTGRDIRSRA